MLSVRTGLADAKRDLDKFGVALLHGVMTNGELAAARQRLDEQAAGEDAAGLAWHDGSEAGVKEQRLGSGPNQRVYNLVSKGEIFRQLAMNAVVLELFRHLLGREFLLSSFSANIAGFGGLPMALHTDQMFAPVETSFPLVGNCLWMLDDFTDENGATRVVPGSHKSGRHPSPVTPVETIPVVAPAGTMMVFDGRLWHGTGANRTPQLRRAILAYYCRPFVRQQENAALSISPEALDACSPELRALLGFKVWNSLGGINGSRSGTLHDRSGTFVAELHSS